MIIISKKYIIKMLSNIEASEDVSGETVDLSGLNVDELTNLMSNYEQQYRLYRKEHKKLRELVDKVTGKTEKTTTKRKANAYNLFLKERMSWYKNNDPNFNVQRTMKLIGEEWKSHPSNRRCIKIEA
jgi:glucan phosphorylase